MTMLSSGLMDAAKQFLAICSSIFSTRLELLANELHEERVRLTQMLFLALVLLFCLGVGIILLTAFIIVLFWETYRLEVLGGLCLLFFGSGIAIAFILSKKAQRKSRLFTTSLAELAKDRERLRGSVE